MKKQIAILGSTGSIGTQALQVIEEHPDRYEAYVLTANNRVEDLIAQARKFKPEAVVIANETKYQQLKDALADLPIKVYAGEEALCQIVAEKPIDMGTDSYGRLCRAETDYERNPRTQDDSPRQQGDISRGGRAYQRPGTFQRYSHLAGRLRTFCRVPVFSRRNG